MSSFLKSYLTCALWSSTDDNENPLDKHFTIADFPPSEIAKAEKVCAEFQADNATDLELAKLTDERAGHCLWLNRNGHGSGFWDEYSQTTCERYNQEQTIAMGTRDFSKRDALKTTCNCPFHACERLSDASHKLGTSDVYVGDDGSLYFF